MAASRFPCRVCGQSTEGVDVYVVCSDCVAEYEQRAHDGLADGGRSPQLPPTRSTQPPLTAREVEARLRRLLDDW